MRTLNDYFVSAEIADVSTADQAFIPIPDGGRLVGLRAVITAAKSTDCTLTAKNAGTAVTNGTVTVVASGSGAGSIFTTDLTTGDGTADFADGGVLEVETDGAGTGGGKTIITAIIRR